MFIPPEADFVPWTAARFTTEQARDLFIGAVAIQQLADVQVKPMPDVCSGAWVRWRPGRFLGLNDIAYAHGGRIAVSRHRGKWFDPD